MVDGSLIERKKKDIMRLQRLETETKQIQTKKNKGPHIF